MALVNIYQYATAQEIADILGTITATQVDANILYQAEMLIDNAIMPHYEDRYQKVKKRADFYDSSLVSITNDVATISNLPNDTDYYSRTIMTILSGSLAGSIYFVDSSNASTVTLQTSTGLTAANVSITLEQQAKAPFYGDLQRSNSTYFKIIPQYLKQAVAYQYQFQAKKGASSVPTPGGKIKSKEVDKTNFQVEFDTTSSYSIVDLIDPRAYELISHLTMLSV